MDMADMPLGGNKLKLIDVIDQLESFDDESTIYVEQPWSPDSLALVAAELEDGGIPDEAAKINAEYFLEVFLANEFLEGWLSSFNQAPSVKDQCLRLIEYAEHDA
ncbi:hypothetical protein [Erwinia aphidicola]|uniref:hypothetical protein n=1 Tax=Erwinia aphidicola TaxID=68334 RepID=UPI003CEE6BC4